MRGLYRYRHHDIIKCIVRIIYINYDVLKCNISYGRRNAFFLKKWEWKKSHMQTVSMNGQ